MYVLLYKGVFEHIKLKLCLPKLKSIKNLQTQQQLVGISFHYTRAKAILICLLYFAGQPTTNWCLWRSSSGSSGGLAQRSGVACVVRGCKEGKGGGLTVGMASQHQSVRMSLAGEVHSRLTEMTTAAAAAATAAAAAAAPAAAAVGTVLVQCAFRGVCVRL